MCRYAGQVPKFYSVAEHSVHVLEEAGIKYNRKQKLALLLHDAAEAYLSDVVKPAKQQMKDYRRIEDKLLACIYEKFDADPRGVEIAKYDDRVYIAERQQIFKDNLGATAACVTIKNYSPSIARMFFLDCFSSLAYPY